MPLKSADLYFKTEEDRQRWRAFFEAVLVAMAAGDTAEPVSILALTDEIHKRAWTPIDPQELRRKVRALGGILSASRHLHVDRKTIRQWIAKGRVPAYMYPRIDDLIAARVKPLLRPSGRKASLCP